MDKESPGERKNESAQPESPKTEDTPRLRADRTAFENLQEITQEVDAERRNAADDPVVEEDVVNTTPIIRMVNAIITTAIEKGASDIHLDPMSQTVSVRCRIDGVLQEIMRLPRYVQAHTFNRFKLMADIPFWHKAPQTGFIPIRHNNKAYNLVVTTVQTPYGDSLKLRILDTETPVTVVSALQQERKTEAALEYAVYYGGLILISGTPGSGKTTTAYALMNRANWVGRVAATLEAQQTYRVRGLVQAYRKSTTTASQIADSLIQQEAQVVFCGDLVDRDMAEAALKIAEAGSVAIASVTAPHAAAAILHLLKLGIAPARLAASLSGVLTQALVGLICPNCRASVPLGLDKAKRLEKLRVTSSPTPSDALPETLDYGEGCDTCHKRGIKGRTALFDFLELDEVTRRLIRTDDAGARLPGSPFTYASANALHEAARAAVLEKRISLDEAERVIYPLAGAAQRML